MPNLPATDPFPPSEKQIAYIESLRQRTIASIYQQAILHRGEQYPRPMRESIANAAFAYSLPATAATAAEASELIDAYQHPTAYAQAHREWARPILEKLAAKLGRNFELAPEIHDRSIGGHHDPADWLAEILEEESK